MNQPTQEIRWNWTHTISLIIIIASIILVAMYISSWIEQNKIFEALSEANQIEQEIYKK